MKKVLSLLLVMIVLLTLCACGAGDSENANVELPSNGKKGPSQDLIQSDIEAALSEIPNATLTGVSTIKSLSEDNYYEITVQVTAATNYADWQLECEMYYTKYDQGWMMDHVAFTSEEYTIKNNFDLHDLPMYCSNYLSENNIFILNTSKNAVEYDAETEQLVFAWHIDYEKKHSTERTNYWIYWKYDPTIDNWVPSSELLSHTDDPIPNYNLDFSGEWDLRNRVTGEVLSLTPIIIKDFSWDGFYSQIPGFFESDKFFEYTEDEPSYFKENPGSKSNFADVIFSDGDGKFITFKFHDYDTLIYYYDDFNDIMLNGYRSAVGYVAYVEVTVDLPDLP